MDEWLLLVLLSVCLSASAMQRSEGEALGRPPSKLCSEYSVFFALCFVLCFVFWSEVCDLACIDAVYGQAWTGRSYSLAVVNAGLGRYFRCGWSTSGRRPLLPSMARLYTTIASLQVHQQCSVAQESRGQLWPTHIKAYVRWHSAKPLSTNQQNLGGWGGGHWQGVRQRGGRGSGHFLINQPTKHSWTRRWTSRTACTSCSVWYPSTIQRPTNYQITEMHAWFSNM